MRFKKSEMSEAAAPAANGVAWAAKPPRRAPESRQPPEPLRMVVVRAQQALAAMTTSETPRTEMHEFRNALADLCALTFPNQDVTGAVACAVEESERYAELSFGQEAARACADSLQRSQDRVWNALKQVIVSLVDAKPSTVARALGRAW